MGEWRKCRRARPAVVGRGVRRRHPGRRPSSGLACLLGEAAVCIKTGCRVCRLAVGRALRRIRGEWTAVARAVAEGMGRTGSLGRRQTVGAARGCPSRRPRRRGGAHRQASAACCQCYPARSVQRLGFAAMRYRGTSPLGSRPGRSRQRTYVEPKKRTTQSSGWQGYSGPSSRWRGGPPAPHSVPPCRPVLAQCPALASNGLYSRQIEQPTEQRDHWCLWSPGRHRKYALPGLDCWGFNNLPAPGSGFVAQESVRGGPSVIDLTAPGFPETPNS